jgi:hypothetical protein
MAQIAALVYFDCGHTAVLTASGELVAVLQLPPHLNERGIRSCLVKDYKKIVSLRAAPATLCQVCYPALDDTALERAILAALEHDGLPPPTPEELRALITQAQSTPPTRTPPPKK